MDAFVLVEISFLKYFWVFEIGCLNIDTPGPRDFSEFTWDLIDSTILNSHCINLIKQNILSKREYVRLFIKIIQITFF